MAALPTSGELPALEVLRHVKLTAQALQLTTPQAVTARYNDLVACFRGHPACLLLVAVCAGCEALVLECLQGRVGSVDQDRTVGGFAAIHIAAALHDQPSLVRLLVHFGANPNLPNHDGATPLHLACQLGNCNVANDLIRLSCPSAAGKSEQPVVDINARDGLGRTPLHCAITSHHPVLVERLVAVGADVNRQCEAGLTPVCVAARERDVRSVRVLCEQGRANTSLTTRAGLSVVHIASGVGALEVLQFLIMQTRVDVEARSVVDVLPLCKSGHNDNLATTLRQMDRLSRSMERGVCNTNFRPLHLACCANNLEVASFLIASGANPFAATSQGHTALHMAAFSGHEEIVRLLLHTRAAFVDARTLGGFTALHLAAQEGFCGVVGLLVDNGADVGATTAEGLAPLHLACEQGHVAAVHRLVRSGADPNARTQQGTTPLHMACGAGHALLVHTLVAELGADPAVVDSSGLGALYLACDNGHTKVVEVLVGGGWCGVDDALVGGLTPLHVAAGRGHVDLLGVLLRAGSLRPAGGGGNDEAMVDVDAQCAEGNTALHLAVTARRLDAVRLLVANGASEAPNVKGLTPLMLAASAGDVDIARCLLDEGDARFDGMCANGLTPMHLACLSGHVAVVRLLQERGADCEARSLSSMTPLALAVLSGNTGTVQFLVDVVGVQVRPLMPDAGFGVLHVAAERGNVDVVRTLVAALVSRAHPAGEAASAVDATTRDGFTALRIAAQQGHLATAKHLVAVGGAALGEEDAEAAAQCGHASLADWARRAVGWTPLMRACDAREAGLVLALLHAGHSPHAADGLGTTALDLAQCGPDRCVWSLPVDPRIVETLQLALLPWSPATHRVWPNKFRATARGVLLLEKRLQRTGHHSFHLPHELWLQVIACCARWE